MTDISNKHRKNKFFVRTVADWNKLEDMVVTEKSVLHSHLQWAVGYKGLPLSLIHISEPTRRA